MVESSNQRDRCPVDHGRNKSDSSWSTWFSQSRDPKRSPSQAASGCPVDHGKSGLSVPASLEESVGHSQAPQPDQSIPLSTQRVVSSIPRADELREEKSQAPHQPQNGDRWVYPSEQQFYNAMRRKGWDGVDETTIPLVVRIHNAVNERGWSEVRRWERELHGNNSPRLVRFMGRPKDMSPRAFINTYMLWYNPPFDRHDWYVDRGDGASPRRYVIDFYNGKDESRNGNGIISSVLNRVRGQENKESEQSVPRPPSMYLDVRPALDSPEAIIDRAKMFFINGFPGLYEAYKQRQHTLTPPISENLKEKTERKP